MRIRRLTVLVTIAVLAGLACQAALGYWSGAGIAGGGMGGAGGAALNQGAAPTVGETGSANVVVKWGSSGMSNGVPADGYVVKRFDAETGTEAVIGGSCSGRVTSTTCSEPEAPVGNWRYSVTPEFSENWHGIEGLKSGAVNTGPGSMTLSKELFGGTVAPLPAVLTATLSGFGPNEPIEFFLDDTVPLASSPSEVNADGTAVISITLPAGAADGTHSLGTRTNSAEASAGILVDTTPPTYKAIVTPPANSHGWNNTVPVKVSGKVNDGNGSGLSFAKYTIDGSDPKTSPTSKIVTKPISITTSTTARFYLTDNAGNESPIETLQVKIDTLPPFFTVDFVDVNGGVYVKPANEETGEPGDAYYRGAAAGSFRFLVTPLPLGGSSAISAGFSELPAEAVGFSFDPSTVTTPLDGPFLSNSLAWVAGTTSTPSGTIGLTDEADNYFGSSGPLYNDSTAPSGGAVDAVDLTGFGGRYSTSLDLNLVLAKGGDSGSGLANGSGPSDLPAKLLRASAPLSSNGIDNGSCGTYSAFTQTGSDNPAPSVSDTAPTDNTCYRYQYLVSDHVGNVATYASPDIKIQTSATSSLRPTDAVLTPVSGIASQSVSGSTIFYNPAQMGSFSVDTSAAAAYSGIAQVSFPLIAGFSGGGTVASPLSGNMFRTTYSWLPNATGPSPGSQPISATNNAGQTSTNSTAFTLVKDDSGPSGGSVDATGLSGAGGRYSLSLLLKIAFSPGVDAGAGLAASGAQLLRASAPLTSDGIADGTCGSFGAYTQVGAGDPVTPRSETVPADRSCYRYQYLVADKVGNPTAYFSPAIKVDASAPPAPVLSFSALTNSFWSGVGTTVFYRPGAGNGGFQVNASSSDTTSGIGAYDFPAFPSGWSSNSVGLAARSYSWNLANPTAPTGTQAVVTTNNAGGTASSSFTATPDAIAPSGGTITYTDGYSTSATLSISTTKGTDSTSGLNAASGIIEVSTATLLAGVCQTFGPYTLAATNPLSPVSLSVTTGTCYKYRYLVSDNVGNQATYTSASTTKVDTVAPTNALSLVSAVNASLTASTIYYRGSVSGSFQIVDAVADSASGPASATFPSISTTRWTHNAETRTSPAGGPYTSTTFSWTTPPTNPSAKTVTGKDAAGNATNLSITFASDTTAPSGGSITYPNGIVSTSSIPITTANGTDVASGINTATTTIKRDVAPLAGNCGSFPGTFATTVTLVGGADTNVTKGNCYRYRYLVTDNVGNQTTYSSANVVKFEGP